MNFESYVEKEFKNGEEKFTKIETKLDFVSKQLIEIQVALKVEEKMQAVKTRNAAIFYGGIMSIVTGTILHLLKGFII